MITGSPDRHGDLAIVALVVNGGATSLHFHCLGGTQSDEQPFCSEPPKKSLQRLTPPALHDGAGRTYQPVGRRPHSAGRVWWGRPTPHEREAITGHWLYMPAAPPDAREFTAERGGFTWTLQDPAT